MLSSTHQGRPHAQPPVPVQKALTKAPVGFWAASTHTALAILALATLVLGSLWTWHYRAVHSNIAWLDRSGARYVWYHQVFHENGMAWRKFQAHMALVIDKAVLSDIYTATIENPSLTDDDLRKLSNLSHLRVLTLISDQASDSTLTRVAGLKQLHSIKLGGDQFTFEGLLKLRALPHLRNLELNDMHLSMAELAVLESALPTANLKYNKTGMHEPYERQVMGRYPKVQKSDGSQHGFAALRAS